MRPVWRGGMGDLLACTSFSSLRQSLGRAWVAGWTGAGGGVRRLGVGWWGSR